MFACVCVHMYVHVCACVRLFVPLSCSFLSVFLSLSLSLPVCERERNGFNGEEAERHTYQRGPVLLDVLNNVSWVNATADGPMWQRVDNGLTNAFP